MPLEIKTTLRNMARPLHPWSQLVKAAQGVVGRSATAIQEDVFNGIEIGMFVKAFKTTPKGAPQLT